MDDAVYLEDPNGPVHAASPRRPFVAPKVEEMGQLSDLTQQDFSIPP